MDMAIQEIQLQKRFTGTMRHCATHIRNHSTTIRTFAHDTLNGFFTTAHHALMVSGVAALCLLAIMFYRPDVAQQLRALSSFGPAAAPHRVIEVASDAVPMDTPKSPPEPSQGTAYQPVDPTENTLAGKLAQPKVAGTERQQRWVTSWLSKRYRVANDATDMLVSAAYVTAKDIKIDPLLILAVVAIESGFNPFAESAVGAQGLMQVMSKIHHEKLQSLGGVKAALNPVANIRVGSVILKDYVSRGGSLEAGLKMYVGAAAYDNDAGYGSKVLAEYRRLKVVATGKNVPLFFTPPAVMARNQPKAPADNLTVPKDASASEDKPIAPEAAQKLDQPEQLAVM